MCQVSDFLKFKSYTIGDLCNCLVGCLDSFYVMVNAVHFGQNCHTISNFIHNLIVFIKCHTYRPISAWAYYLLWNLFGMLLDKISFCDDHVLKFMVLANQVRMSYRLIGLENGPFSDGPIILFYYYYFYENCFVVLLDRIGFMVIMY